MGTSIKFIFKPSTLKQDKTNHNDPLGFIYVQRIENRKNTYSTLGLPKIPKRLWDTDKQRVRKNQLVDYEGYNDTIESKLKELIENDKAPLQSGKSREKSFLKFFDKSLNSSRFSNKHGTKAKYKSVFKKLQGYLTDTGKSDLLFSELSVEFLDDFQVYMLETGMEPNTVTHYLKVVNGFVRRSMVDRKIMNKNNPFDNFKFEKKRVKLKETLSREEVRMIMDFPLKNDRLDKVRRMFLFQFFNGGMRVSDLVTLRYMNLNNGKVSYVMFKTKFPMPLPITELVIDLLHPIIGLKTNIDTYVSSNFSNVDLKERKKKLLNSPTSKRKRPSPIPSGSKLISLLDVPNFLFLEENDMSSTSYNLPSTYSSILHSLTHDELIKEGKRITTIIDNKGEYMIKKGLTFSVQELFNKKRDLLIRVLHDIEDRILQVRQRYYDACKDEIHQLSINPETRNRFVFGRLKESDFQNVIDQKDFSNITELQYKKINRAGIVYNRNLTELQKAIGFSKNLSTHLPRTSFANIMMKDKMNHRDISRTLGHSSVSITDEYLRTGFDDGAVGSVIRSTSEDFSSLG